MFNQCFTCNSVKHLNKAMENRNIYLNIFDKIRVLDKNATLQPFWTGQTTGYKIIFDCILTNSALKYIYDICENVNLNLRLTVNINNNFNLIIFKNIK